MTTRDCLICQQRFNAYDLWDFVCLRCLPEDELEQESLLPELEKQGTVDDGVNDQSHG